MGGTLRWMRWKTEESKLGSMSATERRPCERLANGYWLLAIGY
jgi:hypothetical protein